MTNSAQSYPACSGSPRGSDDAADLKLTSAYGCLAAAAVAEAVDSPAARRSMFAYAVAIVARAATARRLDAGDNAMRRQQRGRCVENTHRIDGAVCD